MSNIYFCDASYCENAQWYPTKDGEPWENGFECNEMEKLGGIFMNNPKNELCPCFIDLPLPETEEE
jgi:hypothetical protein